MGRASYERARIKAMVLTLRCTARRIGDVAMLARDRISNGRNVEVMWLPGRLAPDHKTIVYFRKDNGLGLRKVCARFVVLCREMGLLTMASVANDGSKFKAVTAGTRNSHGQGGTVACHVQ
jgi:hypothetical protein